MNFRKSINILSITLICLLLLISITDAAKPITQFRSNATDGKLNLPVRFIDLSQDAMTWNWSFKDVTGNNTQVWWTTQQNPDVLIFKTGNFSIVLNASNTDGGNISTTPYFINVSSSTAPSTHFFMRLTTNSSDTRLYGAPDILNGYAVGGSYYGGGTQYPAYTAGVAGGSYNGSTISTKTALIDALQDAADGVGGAVIYISPSATIDMTDSFNVEIPANTTIASNRGVGGSRGGRIVTKTLGDSWQGRLFQTAGPNVRITGLVLEGETYTEDYEPESLEGAEYRIGLTIYHTNCTVDNNELWGFAYADLLSVNIPTAGRPWVHHNYINGSWNRHEGYGMEVYGGDALVEGNVFDRNRHDMTGTGEIGEKYTFRYNKILGTPYQVVGMSHVDVHGRQDTNENVSGLRYDIYGNTFYGGNSSAMHQRGLSNGTYVHNNVINVFADDSGWTEDNVPIYQSVPAGYPFGNLYAYDNYWLNISYKNQSGIIWYQEVLMDG